MLNFISKIDVNLELDNLKKQRAEIKERRIELSKELRFLEEEAEKNNHVIQSLNCLLKYYLIDELVE